MRFFAYLLSLVFVLTGCYHNARDQMFRFEATTYSDSSMAYTELSYADFNVLKDGSTPFIVVYGHTECEYCIALKETIKTYYNKTGAKVYYLDFTAIPPTEYDALKPYFDLESTPNTAIIYQAKLVVRKLGSLGLKEFEQLVARYGVIGWRDLAAGEITTIISTQAERNFVLVYREDEYLKLFRKEVLDAYLKSHFKWLLGVKIDSSNESLLPGLSTARTPTVLVYQNTVLVDKFQYLDANYEAPDLEIWYQDGRVATHTELEHNRFKSLSAKQARMRAYYQNVFKTWIEGYLER